MEWDGYKGGEIASKLAAESTVKYIKSNFENAIEYANMVVYEKSKEDKELEGMGTTLELCLIYNNKAYIGHVGDSRIYRIRKDVIRKLTKDHSYVQQLVEDKKITREEAKTHPKKNMLTKALGCTPYGEPDIRARNFEKGDVFIMCSDGLTNMVEEKRIQELVKENINTAADNLIKEANEAGGFDNITVIIIN